MEKGGQRDVMKILKSALLMLLAALCFGCACAAAETETAPAVIQPEPILLRMDQLAGKTVLVSVGEYDDAEHLLTLTVLEKLRFAAEAVEGLQPGDVLNLDGELLAVQDVEPMTYLLLLDDGGGVDEASIWLKKGEDSDYAAGQYSDFIWRQVGSASFSVAQDAEFLDGINPEDGDMLESPTRHSMEAFLRIKSEEETRGDPGFACHNVRATFNAEGEIASLERFYVPWQ